MAINFVDSLQMSVGIPLDGYEVVSDPNDIPLLVRYDGLSTRTSGDIAAGNLSRHHVWDGAQWVIVDVKADLSTHEADTNNPHNTEVIQDASPQLGGALETRNNHIVIQDQTFTEQGRIGELSNEDGVFIARTVDNVYDPGYGGALFVPTGVSLQGSTLHTAMLEHDDPTGYMPLNVTSGGIVFGSVPPDPGWMETDTSTENQALPTLGVWQELEQLLIVIPEDVALGDRLDITTTVFVSNGSATRGGTVGIGFGIDGAQPNRISYEGNVSGGFSGALATSFSTTTVALTTGQTISLWVQRSSEDHGQFDPSVDGTIGTHEVIVSVPGAGSGGSVGPPGQDGADGADGFSPYIDTPTGEWVDSGGLTGVVAEGPAGADGADGAQGVQGEQGLPGADGATGPEGPTAISTDANNQATLGTDNLTMVDPAIESNEASGVQSDAHLLAKNASGEQAGIDATVSIANVPSINLYGPATLDSVATYASGVEPSADQDLARVVDVLQQPLINNLSDSGRWLDASGLPFNATTSAVFDQQWARPYNGAMATDGGKFYHNNSTFGGTGTALNSDVESLINATSRNGLARAYGPEFYILNLTAGSGTTATFNNRHLMSNASIFCGPGNWAQFAFWACVKSGATLLRSTSFSEFWVNGVKQSLASDWYPTVGTWYHVAAIVNGPYGYFGGALYFYGVSGDIVQIAMPIHANGRSKIKIHSSPVFTVGVEA